MSTFHVDMNLDGGHYSPHYSGQIQAMGPVCLDLCPVPLPGLSRFWGPHSVPLIGAVGWLPIAVMCWCWHLFPGPQSSIPESHCYVDPHSPQQDTLRSISLLNYFHDTLSSEKLFYFFIFCHYAVSSLLSKVIKAVVLADWWARVTWDKIQNKHTKSHWS